MIFQPSRYHHFPALSNPNAFARASVAATMDPFVFAGGVGGGTNAWHSLDRVTLLPADITPHFVGGSGEPGFLNAWVNYDSALYTSASFFKDSQNIVHLEGLVRSGTMSTDIFRLPQGFFPSDYQYLFPVISMNLIGRIDVYMNGTVQQVAGSNGWMSMDGLLFPVGFTWTDGTYQNGWTSYGYPFAPAGYCKDNNGIVYLRGLVRSGTMPQAIFTLPSGCWPDKISIFVTTSNEGVGRIDVGPSGIVSAEAGSNAWITLDGISFPAAGTATYAPVAYQNGWVDYNPVCNSAGYYRDAAGTVRVRGMIAGGTSGTAAFSINDTFYVHEPLSPNVKSYAIDAIETMAYLNAQRQSRGLPLASFTPPAPSVSPRVYINDQHILDFRAAAVGGVVDYASASGSSGSDPTFSAFNTSNPIEVLRQHLEEVRQVVDDAMNGAKCAGCSSSCGVACSSNCISTGCAGGCLSACSTSCGAACDNRCFNNCGTGCTGTCAANNCTGGCGGLCANGCYGSCSPGCTGGCYGLCANAYYSGANYGGCVCGASCASSCGNVCASYACSQSCLNACSGACSGVCAATACSGNCGVACTTVCGAGCDASCRKSCSTDACSTNCTAGCQNACFTTCLSSCSSGCSNTQRYGADASGRP